MEKTFNFSREIITSGRIILIDEPLSVDVRSELTNLRTTDDQELIFIEDRSLAINLEKILNDIIKKEQNILFVFPGNGSNYPRKLSQIWKNYPNTGVNAKRIWQQGTDPVAIVDIILPEMFLIMNIKTIIVVDDVISSGLTLRKLYQKNSWRFTQAKWIGTSWISQDLVNGIRGYEYIETSCLIKKYSGSGKVPINSLSTLRNNSEIAKNYAQRHFKEPEIFLEILQK